MNYSRKQLEALGEPFGESATALKPGGRIYGGGGGGGPSTSTQISELPEWARPYAQKALGAGEALAFSPYQTYGGDRFAGFSPTQLAAQETIKGMGPASQVGTATGLAGLAGAEAFRAGQYTPGQFSGGTFTPSAAGYYMSPFMEAAIAPQLREAQRASDVLGTQQAGQAVQAGAFGGSRAGLLEAERQRNLGTQMGDIRARGMQTAYEQAANQFNQDMQRRMQAQQLGEQSRQFGAGLGLQGLGTALSAAGQLGQLGQTEFGQRKDVLGMQREVGKEEQELRQRGLTQAYQDFLDERNAPYKQLGFFSDLIRGLPLGQQSTRQMYEAPPTFGQTLGSIGMGAYGLKQLGMFAEGGSVTDDRFVESSLEKMSDQQLAQAERVAMMRNDKERLAMIAEEKAMRASERRGLAGAFNQIPQQAQQQMLQAARGGIVAFNGEDESYVGDEEASAGDPTSAIGGMPSFIPMTAEERQAAIRAAQQREAEMRGASPLTPFIQDIVKQKEALGSRREENKGLIALAAAQALSKGSGLRRGLGEMFGAIGATAASVNKDLRDSERLIKQSELALAQAEEARKNMQFDKAAALVDRSETFAAAADQRKQAADTKRVEIASRERTAKANRESADIRAAKQREAILESARIQADRDRQTTQDRQINDIFKALREDPANAGVSDVQLKAQATRDYINSIGRVPGTVQAERAGETQRTARMNAMRQDPAYGMAVIRASSTDPKVKESAEATLKRLRQEYEIDAPAAPSAAGSQNILPLPAKAADAVVGRVYQTSRGPARWDGSQFILVDR